MVGAAAKTDYDPRRMGKVTAAALLFLSVALGAQEHGRTNWDGVFTEAQAARGGRHYAASCSGCHADDLLGAGDAPALVGAPFMSRFVGSTVDDMVEIVRRTMPQEAPNSLGTEAYVDLVAYMLRSNGSPAGSADLPIDRAKLQQILITAKEFR